jgi:hypothetical protein
MAGCTPEGIPGGGSRDRLGKVSGAQAAKAPGAPDADPDSAVPQAPSARGNGDFAAFAARLKAAHDSIAQRQCGGTISGTHEATPANFDRLWSTWQRSACS